MKRFFVTLAIAASCAVGFAGVASASEKPGEVPNLPYAPLEPGLYHTGNDGAAWGVYAESPSRARADYFDYEAWVWENHPRVAN